MLYGLLRRARRSCYTLVEAARDALVDRPISTGDRSLAAACTSNEFGHADGKATLETLVQSQSQYA